MSVPMVLGFTKAEFLTQTCTTGRPLSDLALYITDVDIITNLHDLSNKQREMYTGETLVTRRGRCTT